MKLNVQVDTSSYVTQPRDPEDDWDRDNTGQTINSVKVYAGEQDSSGWASWGYPEVDPDVEMGDKVYVVILRYSTGDTFGHDDGEHAVADVFKYKEDALDLKSWFEGWNIPYSIGKPPKVVPFEDEFAGKTYRIPWAGYFEVFEGVEVYECEVLDSRLTY